jgi:hypothetical protein
MDERLKRAKDWLYRYGRPLDVARYEYLFSNGQKSRVIDVLKSFQNLDGGFGHGLEADSFNPFSSPIQTQVAFEIIDELALEADHEIVMSTIKYLKEKAPRKDGLFLASIPSNNIFPRASWWTYSAEGAIWGYNPTIALAGFMYKYGNKDNSVMIEAKSLIQQGIDDFNNNSVDNMHELKCFLQMANLVEDLSEFTNHELFLEKLSNQIEKNLEQNKDLWFRAYCARPLLFFEEPKGHCFPRFSQLTKENVEMILKNMNKDGIWDITWEWNDYLQESSRSKVYWQSYLIVSYIKSLKAFKVI